MVGEIAAASKEQAQGIEQVNTAVTEMDKVTQQNAANAAESASASEEMNAQAEQMKGMVGELVALVEGSRSVNVNNGQRATVHHKTVATTVRTPKAKTTHHKNQVVAETADSGVVHPDQLIPFDDKDLNDF